MQRVNMPCIFKKDSYSLGILSLLAHEDVATLITANFSQSLNRIFVHLIGNYFEQHLGQANIFVIVAPVSNNVHTLNIAYLEL